MYPRDRFYVKEKSSYAFTYRKKDIYESHLPKMCEGL